MRLVALELEVLLNGRLARLPTLFFFTLATVSGALGLPVYSPVRGAAGATIPALLDTDPSFSPQADPTAFSPFQPAEAPDVCCATLAD